MSAFVHTARPSGLRRDRVFGLKAPRTAAHRHAKPALKARTLLAAIAAALDVTFMVTVLIAVGCSVAPTPAAGLTRTVVLELGFALLAASGFAGRAALYGTGKLLNARVAMLAALPMFAVAAGAASVALATMGVALAPLAIGIAAASIAFILYLFGSRLLLSEVVAVGIARGKLTYRVVVLGPLSDQVLPLLGSRGDAHRRASLLEVVATFDTEPSAADSSGAYLREPRGPVRDKETLARAFHQLATTMTRERLDAILLAYPPGEAARLQAAFRRVSSSVLDIFAVTGTLRCGLIPRSHPLGALPLLPLQKSALRESDLLMKSLFDRIIGSILLIIALPVIAVTALAIRLESSGPIFFRQPRIGYDNRSFSMFKFRSMYTHMTDRMASRQTSRDDPRITRVGKVIRRFSIDELPQLLNVVRGEMSLVGPRPHAPNTNVDGLLLEQVVDGYKLRHRVMPGITGWAQINGSRGALVSPEQMQRRLKLDLEYIERWSPLLDLKIIALTGIREIFSKAAY